MRERERSSFQIYGRSELGPRWDKLDRQYKYKRNIECFRETIVAVAKK
jgi:hypothetical protein